MKSRSCPPLSTGHMHNNKYDVTINMAKYITAIRTAAPTHETSRWREREADYHFKKNPGKLELAKQAIERENKFISDRMAETVQEDRKNGTIEYMPGYRIGKVGRVVDCYPLKMGGGTERFRRLHGTTQKGKRRKMKIEVENMIMHKHFTETKSSYDREDLRKSYQKNRETGRIYLSESAPTQLHLGLVKKAKKFLKKKHETNHLNFPKSFGTEDDPGFYGSIPDVPAAIPAEVLENEFKSTTLPWESPKKSPVRPVTAPGGAGRATTGAPLRPHVIVRGGAERATPYNAVATEFRVRDDWNEANNDFLLQSSYNNVRASRNPYAYHEKKTPDTGYLDEYSLKHFFSQQQGSENTAQTGNNTGNFGVNSPALAFHGFPVPGSRPSSAVIGSIAQSSPVDAVLSHAKRQSAPFTLSTGIAVAGRPHTSSGITRSRAGAKGSSGGSGSGAAAAVLRVGDVRSPAGSMPPRPASAAADSRERMSARPHSAGGGDGAIAGGMGSSGGGKGPPQERRSSPLPSGVCGSSPVVGYTSGAYGYPQYHFGREGEEVDAAGADAAGVERQRSRSGPYDILLDDSVQQFRQRQKQLQLHHQEQSQEPQQRDRSRPVSASSQGRPAFVEAAHLRGQHGEGRGGAGMRASENTAERSGIESAIQRPYTASSAGRESARSGSGAASIGETSRISSSNLSSSGTAADRMKRLSSIRKNVSFKENAKVVEYLGRNDVALLSAQGEVTFTPTGNAASLEDPDVPTPRKGESNGAGADAGRGADHGTEGGGQTQWKGKTVGAVVSANGKLDGVHGAQEDSDQCSRGEKGDGNNNEDAEVLQASAFLASGSQDLSVASHAALGPFSKRNSLDYRAGGAAALVQLQKLRTGAVKHNIQRLHKKSVFLGRRSSTASSMSSASAFGFERQQVLAVRTSQPLSIAAVPEEGSSSDLLRNFAQHAQASSLGGYYPTAGSAAAGVASSSGPDSSGRLCGGHDANSGTETAGAAENGMSGVDGDTSLAASNFEVELTDEQLDMLPTTDEMLHTLVSGIDLKEYNASFTAIPFANNKKSTDKSPGGGGGGGRGVGLVSDAAAARGSARRGSVYSQSARRGNVSDAEASISGTAAAAGIGATTKSAADATSSVICAYAEGAQLPIRYTLLAQKVVDPKVVAVSHPPTGSAQFGGGFAAGSRGLGHETDVPDDVSLLVDEERTQNNTQKFLFRIMDIGYDLPAAEKELDIHKYEFDSNISSHSSSYSHDGAYPAVSIAKAPLNPHHKLQNRSFDSLNSPRLAGNSVDISAAAAATNAAAASAAHGSTSGTVTPLGGSTTAAAAAGGGGGGENGRAGRYRKRGSWSHDAHSEVEEARQRTLQMLGSTYGDSSFTSGAGRIVAGGDGACGRRGEADYEMGGGESGRNSPDLLGGGGKESASIEIPLDDIHPLLEDHTLPTTLGIMIEAIPLVKNPDFVTAAGPTATTTAVAHTAAGVSVARGEKGKNIENGKKGERVKRTQQEQRSNQSNDHAAAAAATGVLKANALLTEMPSFASDSADSTVSVAGSSAVVEYLVNIFDKGLYCQLFVPLTTAYDLSVKCGEADVQNAIFEMRSLSYYYRGRERTMPEPRQQLRTASSSTWTDVHKASDFGGILGVGVCERGSIDTLSIDEGGEHIADDEAAGVGPAGSHSKNPVSLKSRPGSSASSATVSAGGSKGSVGTDLNLLPRQKSMGSLVTTAKSTMLAVEKLKRQGSAGAMGASGGGRPTLSRSAVKIRPTQIHASKNSPGIRLTKSEEEEGGVMVHSLQFMKDEERRDIIYPVLSSVFDDKLEEALIGMIYANCDVMLNRDSHSASLKLKVF